MTSLDDALDSAPPLGRHADVAVIDIPVPVVKLDAVTVGPLAEDLRELANRTAWEQPAGPVLAVIDLVDVELLTAAAVNVLVEAADRLQTAGVELVLIRPNRLARRVLDVCGVAADLGLPPR